MALKKLKDSKLNDTSELTKQRMDFKSLLSKIEQMLNEQQNQSCLNLINENTNLAESSYTDLEKLVNIVEGTTLSYWNAQKNSYMIELEKTKSWWDQHIKTFIEKSNQRIQQILSLIKKEIEVYQMKDNLYDLFTYIQDIDETIYKKILEILRKEKVSDILGFLSKTNNQIFVESIINEQKITNVLRNIQDHKFSKDDYSSETYEKARQDLIKRMKDNKGITDFIKFLVILTSIDVKQIQSGSNGLSLLVAMKVDLRKVSFENIRIKNTSLIGGNFVRCNMNGSQFENVDISGVNFNGEQMFNCKWKNIKVHELNQLDGHSNDVNSVCFSPDGNTLASGSRDDSIRLWDIKNKYCSDYRFKEIQVKNTKFPFFNTPFAVKEYYLKFKYILYYGLPRLQFFKFQKNRFLLGELLEQHLINLKTNLYQPLIQLYFNILHVSNIC
ncbi:unnamed protein product [Paramecium pentaurelia]|uniref:Uncharacterized protein n=1 Tax=Paramecium pentaurelia TaxID=43138 RepID=A0A8S1TQD3_9CILI|nr:unnamed protein product [Paramecium pentaurelia]